MKPEDTYSTESQQESQGTMKNQPPSEGEAAPVYESDDLLKGTREIVIRHHGEIYRLRLTRNNKLILNK